MKCPICKVDMNLGQAIRVNTTERPRACWHSPPVITVENLAFQFCQKCPNCGCSDDDVREFKDQIITVIGIDHWHSEYSEQYMNGKPAMSTAEIIDVLLVQGDGATDMATIAAERLRELELEITRLTTIIADSRKSDVDTKSSFSETLSNVPGDECHMFPSGFAVYTDKGGHDWDSQASSPRGSGSPRELWKLRSIRGS